LEKLKDKNAFVRSECRQRQYIRAGVAGGFADRALGQELCELENEIRTYLNLGAEITVEDSSEEIVMSDDE